MLVYYVSDLDVDRKRTTKLGGKHSLFPIMAPRSITLVIVIFVLNFLSLCIYESLQYLGFILELCKVLADVIIKN